MALDDKNINQCLGSGSVGSAKICGSRIRIQGAKYQTKTAKKNQKGPENNNKQLIRQLYINISGNFKCSKKADPNLEIADYLAFMLLSFHQLYL